MKKLFFIMMAMLASFSMYAETAEKDMVEEISVANSGVVEYTFDVNMSNITYPYIITVTVPTDRIVSVSGPCQPNVIGWNVVGSTLTIPLIFRDLMHLSPGDIGKIEVISETGVCCKISLNIM